MTGDTTAKAPDRPAPPPAAEGAGLPPNPDKAVEAKRREIERAVYARRTAGDQQPGDPQPPPIGEI